MTMAAQSNVSGRAAVFPVLFGFFVMGFVDVVGIAANYVKEDFALSDAAAGLLPMTVFLWFALFSVPTGILMGRIGRRNTVAVALGVTVAAMLVPLLAYDFAAVMAAFALLGIGNTILQVALNPMAAHVVRSDRITSVLTLGQFIKAVSSFLGPILAGAAAARWGDWKLVFPAYALASLLATGWLLTAVGGTERRERTQTTFGTTLALFADREIVLLFLGILLVVGIDVGLNTSIPKLLMERTGMPLDRAGLGTSLYFAARTAGAFLGAIVLTKLSAVRFLRASALLAIAACAGLTVAASAGLLYGLIAAVGLACANLFSILFSLALRRRPERSNEISALMIMGVSGGALVTPLMGFVADRCGQGASLAVLLACMVYIAAMAFRWKR